jgi:NAD(P)-dependent dehydrogenase (short-subunit alcohol dehydrogenase family)
MTASPKTILITGSTDGIGKAAAIELAAMGHRVIVHGRNTERAQRAADDVRTQSGNATVETVVADFTSLREVRAMAADVVSRFPRLDVLINNAGVYMKDRVLTEDGFETTFQVNYLAHVLLTHLLLDLLKRSAPSRIINVSSMAHHNAKLSLDNLQGEKKYGAYGAYACSKLENILFTYELAERLEGTGVTVNCLHPGVIATKLLRAGFGGFGGSGVEKGAETIIFLATSPRCESVSGKYFVNKEITDSSLASHDRGLRKKLWELSMQFVGIT